MPRWPWKGWNNTKYTKAKRKDGLGVLDVLGVSVLRKGPPAGGPLNAWMKSPAYGQAPWATSPAVVQV
jgi:hypothetical protein